MRIEWFHLRCCLQLMLAASILLVTTGRLKQPVALGVLESSARVSTRSLVFFGGTVEEVASQTDVGSSSAAVADSVAPIEINTDLAEQAAYVEYEETDRPSSQVFHRRILPPSPDDDK
jgi:hypothetical protein